MERFAIKIDKKLKANLYKICRLCGIDNPDMVPIISDKQANKNENVFIDVDAEMEMQQKINLLVGLSITKDDRMPQTMCCLCVDKINDFYEFREMCYATNAQTRKLLGLKNIKKPSMDIKPKVEVKDESIVPTSTLMSAQNKNGNRKRKCEEIGLKEETIEITAGVSKKKLRFSMPIDQAVKEETPVVKKKLRVSATNEFTTPTASSSKKSKNNTTEETKLKKEPSPQEPIPPTAVSNKKLRLAVPIQKESVAKKSKQKGVKISEQRETDVKEEIKAEIKEEIASIPPAPKPVSVPSASKLKFGCNICKERFPAKNNLETHNRATHIPKIERYVCTACNEVLSKSFDIKNHQLWHKLSKTPYVCGCCGESIMNTYAFSRHLREHAFETRPALLVLDRECPQCHTSYATNFLYNIHMCAVKTKRCAGCNRLQRNDAEYLKHSAQCAKAYLNYSKHIMPSVEALEDAVRIKNENDVEAAAEEMARISGVPLDMAPVVQLTRLSSPLIMAASQCVSMAVLDDAASSSIKKSGKKGVSKKDLKRVDELLKSTLDALVSIKHEPEVHVDQETPCAVEHSDNEGHHGTSDHASDQDDFHHNNDDSNNETREVNTSTNVINTTEINATPQSGQEQIKIKQEIDEISEENSNKIGGGLKLKIKKEHGQLNSSIIEQQKSSEKRAEKRKKKKKHKDKEKDKQRLSKDMQDEQVSQDSNINNYNSETNSHTTAIRIKAEPQDGSDSVEKSTASVLQMRPQPEATIMTSIPMMQFQIACISSGVEFNNGTNSIVETHGTMSSANHDAETEDVKPNREELDRMLKISHVSSGIVMETDEAKENDVQQIDHDRNYEKGNSDNGEGDYQDESNEEDRDRDDIEGEHREDNQYEHPEEEQEAEDKIANDGKSSENTGIDNKEIIAKKIKKLTLKPKSKPKLNFRPKEKVDTLTTVTKSRNKACKSTAKPPNMPIIQISDVQSGVTLEPSAPSTSDFIPVFIKPEPQNRGYSDEQDVDAALPAQLLAETQEEIEELSLTHSVEERNYISSIDFNNITIKQEKDIEINDVHITPKSMKSFRELNGIKRKRKHAPRSHCNKDKTLEQNEKMENKDDNMEDEEEYDTDEEEEEENVDDEFDEQEEDEEEVEEEEDDEEDEEEYEEREYRELEYPPELFKNRTEVETEEHNGKMNEDNNKTEVEGHDSNVKDNICDTPKDSDSNIAFVIANVCSQANTLISDVYLSKPNDDNVDHGQALLTHDSNILTPANNSDGSDFKMRHCEQDDDNAKNLSYTTDKQDTYTRDSPSTEIPNVIGAQTGLKTTVTSNESKEENLHSVPPMLSTQVLQENTQPHGIPLHLGQPFPVNSDESVGQITVDLNCNQQEPHEQFENQGTKSQYTVQNHEENMGQVFKEDTRSLQDQGNNSLNAQENIQNTLQYSTASAPVGQKRRLVSIDQEQDLLKTTAKHSEEIQSSSHVLLENLNYIDNYEVKPQTSQNLQSVCEISSLRTPILNVSSELNNNPSSNDDGQQISKDNQEETAMFEGVVQQPEDFNLEAQPVIENFDNESVNDDDEDEDEDENEHEEDDNNNGESVLGSNIEERQNYQNQEVLSQIRPTALALHPYLEDISSSSNSFLSNSLSQTPPPPLQPAGSTACATDFDMPRQEQQPILNTEETENILNESNDVLSRRSFELAGTSAISIGQPLSQPHFGQQLPPNMPTFNFDNINEIAENNNNANIEREQLQDEQQQQQRQHQHHHHQN